MIGSKDDFFTVCQYNLYKNKLYIFNVQCEIAMWGKVCETRYKAVMHHTSREYDRCRGLRIVPKL